MQEFDSSRTGEAFVCNIISSVLCCSRTTFLTVEEHIQSLMKIKYVQALAAIPSIDSEAVQQRLDRVRTFYELLNLPFEVTSLKLC